MNILTFIYSSLFTTLSTKFSCNFNGGTLCLNFLVGAFLDLGVSNIYILGVCSGVEFYLHLLVEMFYFSNY